MSDAFTDMAKATREALKIIAEKPQSCVTCDHCNKKKIHARYDKFDTYEFYCNKFTVWIFGTAYNTLEIVGCASHSSHQSELHAPDARYICSKDYDDLLLLLSSIQYERDGKIHRCYEILESYSNSSAQCERDKVLDELDEWVNDHLKPPNNIPRTSNLRVFSVAEIVAEIGELRGSPC